MGAEERRSLRDDLASLRIERAAGEEPSRPRWRGPALLASLALAFLGASLLAYRLTLGGAPVVEVAFAERVSGSAPSGVVLKGSGYVVTAARYISLGVRVPGRIEAYLVEEGERVVAGQPLVRLDGRQYEAALGEARASLRLARANVSLRRNELQRLQALRDQDISSEADLDVKQNQLRVAEAEVDRLRAQIARLEIDLEDTLLKAPSDGVILEKFKEVGEIATPGGFAGSGELIRMANLEELRAEVDVNEANLAQVRLDQDAEVIPDAYPDRRYPATVVKLAPQIDRQKGTLEVEVRILEPDEWLRPDMSVRISFLERAAHGPDGPAGVLVPQAALRSDPGGSFVWLVREGRLRRQAVETTGAAREGRVFVAAGLSGGEALVVGEVGGLTEGRAVETRPAAEPQPGEG